MFDFGQIWAYPTNTSFGLGVRADDCATLQKLFDLKGREAGKYFSLMLRDLDMLRYFAEVPVGFPENYFTEKPRTVLLRPRPVLLESSFWPSDKVAFRVSTIPEVTKAIEYPITATSANFSGEPPIFLTQKIRDQFGSAVEIFPGFSQLSENEPSEIWDYTVEVPVRLR
jgi:L-threonylcarbamoyladenylate synthase